MVSGSGRGRIGVTCVLAGAEKEDGENIAVGARRLRKLKWKREVQDAATCCCFSESAMAVGVDISEEISRKEGAWIRCQPSSASGIGAPDPSRASFRSSHPPRPGQLAREPYVNVNVHANAYRAMMLKSGRGRAMDTAQLSRWAWLDAGGF